MHPQSKTDMVFIASAAFIAFMWFVYAWDCATNTFVQAFFPPAITVLTMIYITSFRLEKVHP